MSNVFAKLRPPLVQPNRYARFKTGDLATPGLFDCFRENWEQFGYTALYDKGSQAAGDAKAYEAIKLMAY